MSKKPNCIKVAARQYPVTNHYAKVTKTDYVEAAFKKIKKIHETLPAGGILVFLTGKKEINYLCQRLKLELNKHRFEIESNSDEEEQKAVPNAKPKDLKNDGMSA